MKALKSMFYSLIVLLVLISTASAAPLLQEPPEIFYVKLGGIGECSSWEDACDLQTAIGKLPDQIWVAAGIYTPTAPGGDRNISFELESGLKIYGGFPAEGGDWEDRDWELHPTILSGDLNGNDGEDFANNEENSYHVLTATDVNRLAKLDGFIITGGNADGDISISTSNGGGMYSLRSSPRLNNLKFFGNYAYRYGSGMYNDQSNPGLTHVKFEENEGIALHNNASNPTLIDVQFVKNKGIGMSNHESNPTLLNVTFIENGPAGGLLNRSSSPKLTDVFFLRNFAEFDGGGMRNEGGNPILTNVSFIGNTANVRGGGMYNLGNNTNPTLINVTFSGNSALNGGGIYNNYSASTLINVTLFGNTATGSGGGIYNWSPEANPTNITNTILWGNTANTNDSDQIFVTGSTSPIVSYSVIQGGCPTGVTCEDIITGDPLLGPLADNGGFTQTHALLPGSSAVDAGNSDPAVCPDADQRGYTRPIGAGCDIGAYEYGYTLDVLIEGNGSVFIDPDKSEYNLDEQVALTATADPGWTFTGWSGAEVKDNTVTITGDTTVTANFTQDEYTLTVKIDPEDSGTVTLDPSEGPYYYGDVVTLTPTANPGYTFDSWSGAEVKDNTVTITGNTTVIAHFAKDEQAIYLPLILR